ncbi:hypothetical protein [Actinoplanes awajinensis]|nr:hypothetical protein [Actinoplanes awajinensis]
MLPATRTLLDSLDPLPYRDRMRHLADWARTAPDRAEVCAELRAGDGYARHLALVAALVVDDRAAIDAATRDPLPGLRSVALTAALRAGRLTGRVAELAAMDRRRIYRTLRVSPAPAIADALIGEIRAEYGDDEAAALLPACGEATVRDLLPDLAHTARLDRLARRHPELMAAYAADTLAAAHPESRAREWERLAAAVLALTPSLALDLLERFPPEDRLPGDPAGYGALATHAPARVARLFAAPARTGWLRRITLPPSLLRRLVVLPDTDLVPLARRLASIAPLLRVLAPARRPALYDAVLAEQDPDRSRTRHDLLDLLPANTRVLEARRMLTVDTVRADEDLTLQVSAYLDWPSASAALEVATRAGDPGVRARAYFRLVEAAGRSRDPDVVAAVVTRLTGLRNEQDPVRAAALMALAEVARLLTAGVAAALTRLTADAVDARDTSVQSTAALSRLAVETLRHHVEVPELRDWALLTIGRIGGDSRMPVLARFDLTLRRGQETLVFAALRDWVASHLDRGSHAPLFVLTAALGRRAWQLPGLQELLHRATGPQVADAVARQAIEFWLADPRTRPARVAEVLAADPSAATIPVVWQTLCARRTDLLDRVLSGRVRGRFGQAGVRWAPPWPTHVTRWLPRQQAKLVEVLAFVLADTGVDVWHRATAVRAAAAAGVPGRELLLRYADADEVPIAEAALGALVWTDRPDLALPVLLAHAGDDRARVAMYAAARAAKHLPPADLTEPFAALLSGPAKVTSRKEAVRILARYGPPSSIDRLLAVYTAPDQHRDVRAAIAGAARQRLDREASWAILDRAVGGSREERAAVLAAMPYAIPARHRPRYAALVVAACRADDREVRRAAFGVLHHWSRWAGDTTDLLVDRLTDLDEPLAHVQAAILLSGTDYTALGRALARVAEVTDADARPGADLPARRRIEVLAKGASALGHALGSDADRSVPLAAIRELAARPGYRPIALTAMLDLGSLEILVELADRCAGRPVIAARVAERIGRRLRNERAFPSPAVLQELIERLIWREDLAGGLFAVQLVGIGAAHGWAGRWRDLVQALRSHPNPDVRDDALAITMS